MATITSLAPMLVADASSAKKAKMIYFFQKSRLQKKSFVAKESLGGSAPRNGALFVLLFRF